MLEVHIMHDVEVIKSKKINLMIPKEKELPK